MPGGTASRSQPAYSASAQPGGKLPKIGFLAQQRATLADCTPTPFEEPFFQGLRDLGYVAGLERAFTRATEVLPTSPETWYDLARVQVALNKREAGLTNLRKAVQLSKQRAAQDPNAFDVAQDARTNRNFDSVRNDPEFQNLIRL